MILLCVYSTVCLYLYTKVYLYDENISSETTDPRRSINLSNAIIEEYSFIRKRTTINKAGIAAGSVYGWTQVQRTHDGQIIEKKRIITKREYNSLFNNRDESRHVVRQTRISFLWNIQSFTIHVYKEPVSDVCILHAQVRSTPDHDEEVAIPPFLDVDKKLITHSEEDEQYGAYHISLKN